VRAKEGVELKRFFFPFLISRISDLTAKKKVRRPYYSSSNSKIPSQIRDYDAVEDSIEMLLTIGPYIHCDPVLIYKVLRVIKFYMEGVEVSQAN